MKYCSKQDLSHCIYLLNNRLPYNTQITELELMIDLHSNSCRQGPGSKEDTLKAFEYINLPTNLPWKVGSKLF